MFWGQCVWKTYTQMFVTFKTRNKSILSNLYLKLIKVFCDLKLIFWRCCRGDSQNETENVRIRTFLNVVTFTKISLVLVEIDLNHIIIEKFFKCIPERFACLKWRRCYNRYNNPGKWCVPANVYLGDRSAKLICRLTNKQ